MVSTPTLVEVGVAVFLPLAPNAPKDPKAPNEIGLNGGAVLSGERQRGILASTDYVLSWGGLTLLSFRPYKPRPLLSPPSKTPHLLPPLLTTIWDLNAVGSVSNGRR